LGAASEACKRLRVAADNAGLPDGHVARLEVMTAEEVHRELERPAYPAVLGIAELAELLGVSRQRASQVARVAAFPKPFAELASGPIWLAPNVERFVQEWERRPGRPRKKKARA